MPNVVWKPQPRQVAFMQRPEDEALYGGAAGKNHTLKGDSKKWKRGSR